MLPRSRVSSRGTGFLEALFLTEPRPLYTPEERRRRDETPWTFVQGILAPIQFLVFIASTILVIRYLLSGEGETVATASVVVKTMLLYLIMVTGCIWEKVVFGQYLFAPAFFWEDVVSMGVMALHTAYLLVWVQNQWTAHEQLALALTAYAAYAFNALQYLRKLRMARLQRPQTPIHPPASGQASTLAPEGARS